MIIVARHECATPVYSVHPINFSTSGMNILQIPLYFRSDMNVHRFPSLPGDKIDRRRGFLLLQKRIIKTNTVESHSCEREWCSDYGQAAALTCGVMYVAVTWHEFTLLDGIEVCVRMKDVLTILPDSQFSKNNPSETHWVKHVSSVSHMRLWFTEGVRLLQSCWVKLLRWRL